MSSIQEDLFNEFKRLQDMRIVANLGMYIQNSIPDVLEHSNLNIDDIAQMKQHQSEDINNLIEKLQDLKKQCGEYFDTFLPLTSKHIRDKLTFYWFMKEGTYNFPNLKLEPADIDFVEDHTFFVKVTDSTVNNVYQSDSEKVRNYCVLDKDYELLSMSVDRNSSTLILLDFPGIEFNTTNFEFCTNYKPKHQ